MIHPRLQGGEFEELKDGDALFMGRQHSEWGAGV
jgi:hypothetical protein